MPHRGSAIVDDEGPQIVVDPVREVELAASPRIPDSVPISGPVGFDAVINRRPPECGRSRDHCEDRGFSLTADDGFVLLVLFPEMFSHFVTQSGKGDELSAEQVGVWWDGAEDVGVHHVVQPLPAIVSVPCYPCIPVPQAEHGIPQRKNTDQFLVASVHEEKPHPSAVAGGYRNAPMQGDIPEQPFVFGSWLDEDKLRVDLLWDYFVAIGDVSDQPLFVRPHGFLVFFQNFLGGVLLDIAKVVFRGFFRKRNRISVDDVTLFP